MSNVVISGSAVWHPSSVITNEELVDSYNAYAEKFNSENAEAIESGEASSMPFSSAEFVYKASGINQRYTYVKEGTLDVERMRPMIE